MWSPPTNNGGSIVTSYIVMISGGTTSTKNTSMTSITINGLTQNTLYTISVSAVNSFGTSILSTVTETTLLSGKHTCIVHMLSCYIASVTDI